MAFSALQIKKRILVIEDDHDVGQSLRDVLESDGYQVFLARNGLEALNMLGKMDPPNLIFLDMMMPVMDGFTFRAKQQSDPALSKIPLVVMSAHVQQKDTDNLKHFGNPVFLRKPMDVDTILLVAKQNCS